MCAMPAQGQTIHRCCCNDSMKICVLGESRNILNDNGMNLDDSTETQKRFHDQTVFTK